MVAIPCVEVVHYCSLFTTQAGGRAVGMMSLSSELDLPLLQKCFQLEPYHGLCKPCDEDEIVLVPDGETNTHCNAHSVIVMHIQVIPYM